MRQANLILSLCLLGLALSVSAAGNSSISCELSSEIKSYMFDYDSITLTAPHIDWFILVKNKRVILQNTKQNITYNFDVDQVVGNYSTPFYATAAIYLKNVDIIVIAGNGAYAVMNATQSPSFQTNRILEAPNAGPRYVFGLQQFSDESFIIGFVDYVKKASEGILYTYNTSTWSRIYRDVNFYPQTFAALSSQELIYSYYGGFNEQRLTLPNLTVIQNISLSTALNSNIYGIVPNNHTSYYVVTVENGVNMYISNQSKISWNYGQEKNISEVNTINHFDSFMVFENFEKVTSYQYGKGPGGYTFSQIGEQNVKGINQDTPYKLAISSGKYDQNTNTYKVQVVTGFLEYYRVYDCTYITNPVGEIQM